MSKLRTDSIEPRLASNVDFGGLDVPSWNGVPLVLPDSPSFNGNPTAPTQADSDNSTKLATTAFAKTRADNAAALEVTNRLATVAPIMDGNTATVGVSTKAAREDHIHPHDSNIAALATSTAASLGASFFLNTAGTYSNVYTTPAAGTLYYLIVGGGGGGGGGGADTAGTPGGFGGVITGSMAIASGVTLSAIVGVGGPGAPHGANAFSLPPATAGGFSSITGSPSLGATYLAAGGVAGITTATPGGGLFVLYHCNDFGDFSGAPIGLPGSPAGTVSSTGGTRALAAYASGADIPTMAFAGDPSVMNGGNGKIGGGGGGGAPTKVFVSSRGFYVDPVDGDGGDGLPTSSGGNGGVGLVYFEFQAANQPRAVTTGTLELLKAELEKQGLSFSFMPSLH